MLELAQSISLADALYVSAALLLICAGIIGYLLYTTMKQDTALRKLNKDRLDSTTHIREFLTSQAKETKAFINGGERSVKLNSKVIALRTAYLNIENKAINHTISSDDYWSNLDDKLTRLLEMFLPQLFGRESKIKEIEGRMELLKDRIRKLTNNKDESPPSPIHTLDTIHTTLKEDISDNDKKQFIVSKIESIVNSYEDISSRDKQRIKLLLRKFSENSGEPLNNLDVAATKQRNYLDEINSAQSQYSDADNAQMGDFHKGAKSLKDENERLLSEIASLQKKIGAISKNSGSSPIVKITSSDEHDADFNAEIDSATRKVNELNSNEIFRLRGVVSDQKRSIRNMEDTIRILDGKSKISDGTRESSLEFISKLKQNVKESENCIATLEQEIDQLRDKLAARTASPSASKSLDAEAADDLNDELAEVNDNINSGEQQHKLDKLLLDFLHDILDANSIEDASFLLYQTLADCSCKANIIVNTANKKIELSPNGTVNNRDKMVLSSMQPGEVNISPKKTRIMFNYKNVAGLLEPDGDSVEFSDMQSVILEIIKVFNKSADKIGAYQKSKSAQKETQIQVNNIKKVALEVDSSMKDLMLRSEQSLEMGAVQYQDIARSQGMDEKTLAAFDHVTDQLKQSLAADEAIRIQVRKQFMTIVQMMENQK
ncbi:hypothetical protein [Teredinibacter waterburyi]|uniref:hypothetical protein n=1 Tax=Teredinibacter waterburyi TaxID=1500538 RepID=UPI00165FA1B1|nr:hypothetical protein [Teredinibacter waterburyi]